MDHAELRRQGLRDHQAKLRHHTDGDVAQDKAMIKEAFAEHDEQLHGGKKTRLKFKRGGHVEGEETRKRLDRPTKKSPRMARADGGDVEAAPMEYARGGRTKKGGHKTQVNVIIGGGHGADAPPAGAPMMPPHPPMMAGPPPGGPPPGVGGPPMGPPVGAGVPMPHKRGGRVKKAYGGGMAGFGGPLVGPGTGFPVQPMPPGAGGAFQSQQQAQPGGNFGGNPFQSQNGFNDRAAPGGLMGGGMQHGPGPGDGGFGALGAAPGMMQQQAQPGRPGIPFGGQPLGAQPPGQMPSNLLGQMPQQAQVGGGPAVGPQIAHMGQLGGAPGMPPMGQSQGMPPTMGSPPMGGPMGRPQIYGQPIGRKRGGRIPDGAGSGPGRLEKTAAYGTEKVGGRENEGFTGDGENKDETEKFRRGGRAHHG